jgi:hypothetical protein
MRERGGYFHPRTTPKLTHGADMPVSLRGQSAMALSVNLARSADNTANIGSQGCSARPAHSTDDDLLGGTPVALSKRHH